MIISKKLSILYFSFSESEVLCEFLNVFYHLFARIVGIFAV